MQTRTHYAKQQTNTKGAARNVPEPERIIPIPGDWFEPEQCDDLIGQFRGAPALPD